ncbi:MAG: hypothetical protein JJU05_02145 [Verrucomicrobia bacterium]|nr:hypothetical protein [Verrucomicrobiota bacterium]MCH8528116.1 hypothetical protein [Kiritimatiellia bacterium]
MTDITEIPGTNVRKESYRLCGACGILVRRAEAVCPECGAPPGDELPGEPSNHIEKTAFGFLTVLALLGALVLLSQNRNTAIETETARLRLLAPIDPSDLVRATEPEQTSLPAETVRHPVQPPPPVQDPDPEPEPAAQPVAHTEPDPDPFGDDDPFGGSGPFGQPDPPETLEPTEPEPSEPAAPSRAERIQQRRAELIEEYTRVLNENHPMHEPGERITLRLNDGTTQTGVLQQLAGGQVQLRLPTGETRWFFSRQLTPETRVRVDPSERQALVQERAWEEALREMQDTP